PQARGHLAVSLGMIALIRVAVYYLLRYVLDFSSRGVVLGSTYTDVKAQLPALRLLIVISLFAFALLIFNIRRRGWVLPVIAVGLWAFVAIVIGAVYPAFIQKFRIDPNEQAKERPYIVRNIDATRRAMNLGDTNVSDFRYD